MSMRWSSSRGITLVEATIVLAVVAIVTALAAPSASRTLDRAREARAIGDAEAIKTAMINFGDDLNSYRGFNIDGSSSSGDQVEMAVSDGDTPIEVSFDGDERWICPVAVTPDPACDVTDFLENHLVLNNPFAGSNLDAYPLSGGNTWRGAYLNAPVDPDPWGNRYAVNVRYLQAPSETKNDVIVLSAGPDEQIDTAYEKDGIFPGDDDIIVVINRNKATPVP